MTWQATISQAAGVSQLASTLEPPLHRLLDHALAGTLSSQEVQSVLGSGASRQRGFIDALDAALRDGYRAEPGLSAARAVLFVLPDFLDDVVVFTEHSMVDTIPGVAADVLDELEQHQATVAAIVRSAPSPRRCPRCGARQVREQYTSALGPRLTEVMCRACGEYGSWMEGDATEKVWTE